jgi:hypothetical protein
MSYTRIDVWHTPTKDGKEQGAISVDIYSILKGLNLMLKWKKEGKQSIRMYADEGNGKRWYYYFKGNTLKKESNNFDN